MPTLSYETRIALKLEIDRIRRRQCKELSVEAEIIGRHWSASRVAFAFNEFRVLQGRWPSAHELHSPLPSYRTVKLYYGSMARARAEAVRLESKVKA